eukprot:TRINITY_DN46764_c0_g1_i1.p1 TRINITY_DN46764_c0_g1~~TRINITY_DN46764_c0_g1_i1.p1  ORF type:complete len:137 (+),score=35.46 TRINITY_DN46764_c0_g1_i1:32-412(+)
MAAMPAEPHEDVGLVTVSHSSSTNKGLQAYDFTAGGWVCLESRDPGCFSVMFGSFLSTLLELHEKRVVCPTVHRVVLPNSTLSPPRYSQIYEVLPHPDMVLVPGKPHTGASVFTHNSLGMHSVNFD